MTTRRQAIVAIGAFLLTGLVEMCMPLSIEARRRVRIRGRGLKPGKYSGQVLTKEQLKACVIQESEINSIGSRLDKEEGNLSKQKDSINLLEARIKRERPLVDQYDKSSVDNFNSLINKHKTMASGYNSNLPSFNSSAVDLNKRVALFNTQCANQAHYESDMNAILAEMKK
jgi:hypothetical protein